MTVLSGDLLGQRLRQVLEAEGVSTRYAIPTDRPIWTSVAVELPRRPRTMAISAAIATAPQTAAQIQNITHQRWLTRAA